MVDYNRIIKECFWDYNISKNEIISIAESNDFREKKHLFEKILLNSTDRIRSIKELFKKNDLIELFDSISINRYNKYAERNILVTRYFLLGENQKIKGLEWKKI
ncbi:MAG: hypothetical protein GY760_10225 [Deltaproteobacteria bacterium]|nr:hypothetical protein [Deltaproteobacteria bacterium]